MNSPLLPPGGGDAGSDSAPSAASRWNDPATPANTMASLSVRAPTTMLFGSAPVAVLTGTSDQRTPSADTCRAADIPVPQVAQIALTEDSRTLVAPGQGLGCSAKPAGPPTQSRESCAPSPTTRSPCTDRSAGPVTLTPGTLAQLSSVTDEVHRCRRPPGAPTTAQAEPAAASSRTTGPGIDRWRHVYPPSWLDQR